MRLKANTTKLKSFLEVIEMIFWMHVGYWEGRREQRKELQAKDRRKYG